MTLGQFTTQASDYAVRVDHLFYLLSAISGLVILLVTGLIVVFFALYYRGSPMPRGEVPERESHEIEIGWTVATLFTFLFIFWWAASDQLTALTPAQRRARNPCRGQTMDVAHPASERRARNRRVACAGRHQCAAGDDVAGRDPRSLSAGAAAQAGHLAGPLHLSVVQRQQDRHLPSDLRRILRYRPFGDGGPLGDRDAGRLCALDRGAAARRRSRPPGRSFVPLARLLGMPYAGLDRARARPARRLRPSGPPVRRPHRHCRRSLSARFHPAAEQGHASPALRRSCRALPAWRARASWSSSWPI